MDKTVSGHRVVAFMTVLLAALVAAGGLFAVLTLEMVETNANSRHDLIQVSEAFALEFEHEREEDAIAPGTFRRQAIERLTENPALASKETAASLRLPGMPGQEVGLRESSPRLRNLMKTLAANEATSHYETRFENGRLISRSVYPVLATEESCVVCHNRLIDGPDIGLGDMMGAYIVESDLTSPTLANLSYSGLAFLGFLISFSLLGRREMRRMQNTVNTLERQVELERDKREAEQRAKFLAKHDPLTGLPNRGLFLEQVTRAIEDAPENLIVALIDLDDFKGINDTYGHDVGDVLLQKTAERIANVVGSEKAMAARLGGDEFAILLRHPSSDMTPRTLGTRLLDAISGPIQAGRLVIWPRGTIGISEGNANITQVETILKQSDMALYVAKERGKGTFALFDKTIAKALERRLLIEEELPSAIVKGDVSPVFQPKVCLTSGKLQGVEVLARWQCKGEAISPAEFTRIAEEIGLTRNLDLAILREASRLVAGFQEKLGHEVHFSTNLSPKNFGSPTIAEDIADILLNAGIAPHQLTIEVTETFPLDNWEVISRCLNELREYGIRSSLDDFGTGYSSLSCLQKLTVDEIKVDRDFVFGVESHQEAAILLESIISMVRGLGRQVVVEGIETEEQARLVTGLGAQIGQGYLYSRPLRPDELLKLLDGFDPKQFKMSA